MTKGIVVNRSLVIPEDELSVRFSPSGGPGGQHANRSSTRVDLTWDIESSRALNDRQRDRLRHHLRTRLDSGGNLTVSANTHRSQLRNRKEAETRLTHLVRTALRPRRARVPTAPTAAARERRLRAKRYTATKKAARRSVIDDD